MHYLTGFIELLVKILRIFWFIVSFYIMYASTYGWIKMNILHRLRAFYTAFSFGQLWKASEPIDSRIWLLIAAFFFRSRDRSGSSFFYCCWAVRELSSPPSEQFALKIHRHPRFDRALWDSDSSETDNTTLLVAASFCLLSRARPSKRGKILERKCRCIGRSDVTESTVTTRSPFCGYNTT